MSSDSDQHDLGPAAAKPADEPNAASAATPPVEAAPAAPPAPAMPAPAEPAPAEPAPAEPAPADIATAESAPAASAPAEPAPEAAPAEAAPAPAEAVPAEAASADGAPAEAASADGAPAAEGAAAAASSEGGDNASSAEGGKKKRRRRRKKKKGDGEEASAEPRPPKRGQKPERPAFNIGDEVFGRVTKLAEHAVLVEVAGGKAHGLFDRAQLIQVPPRAGEQFIAKVKGLSSRGGMLMLGDEQDDTTASRTELRAALESNNTVDCFVTGVIRGGIEVDFKGIRGFAPASHVDMRPNADLSHLLGEKMPFSVVHYGKRGRDVVMSRKGVIEEAYKQQRDELLAKVDLEKEYKAVVRTVLNWGAFVSLPELSDIEGFVHMSEASHDRGARLSDIFKVGKEVAVKVLKVDEKGKLWLSHKVTVQDPWAEAASKYTVGSIHNCEVVRLTDFGAFIRLEPGIDGLCHVADLSLKPVEHPKEVTSEGDMMEVLIANLDAKARRVTLHPAPPEAERELKRVRIKQYQHVDVEVIQIRENGVGVRILGATGRHARGFIPASHTNTARGSDLRKAFALGTKMSVKVLDVDGRRETRLSIRALKQDAEKQAYRDYRKKVQKEASFGTFGDLLKGKL